MNGATFRGAVNALEETPAWKAKTLETSGSIVVNLPTPRFSVVQAVSR